MPRDFRLLGTKSRRTSFFTNDGINAWDKDTAEAIVHEKVATVIQQIPINIQGGVEFLYLPHANFGRYTVGSAR
jgi:hypothetical protein